MANHQKRLLIKNRLGLHARAAVKLVELAQSFNACITVCNDEREAVADSVMGLLMLESAQGQQVTVSATGREAEQALHAICQLIEDGFDEEN